MTGLASDVHRDTGPGLLEAAYERCFCDKVRQASFPFECQVTVPIVYRGLRLDDGFRADVIADRKVILEIKSVAAILPVQAAHLQTYLRISGIRVGLILTFHASRPIVGVRRLVV